MTIFFGTYRYPRPQYPHCRFRGSGPCLAHPCWTPPFLRLAPWSNRTLWRYRLRLKWLFRILWYHSIEEKIIELSEKEEIRREKMGKTKKTEKNVPIGKFWRFSPRAPLRPHQCPTSCWKIGSCGMGRKEEWRVWGGRAPCRFWGIYWSSLSLIEFRIWFINFI